MLIDRTGTSPKSAEASVASTQGNFGTHRQPPPRIDFIQGLRGVAALLVTIFHILKEAHRANMTGDGMYQFAITLQFGVDLFFIISGFIMIYVMENKPTGPHAGRTFLVKRLLRIVPLYWLYTIMTAVMMVALPQVMNASQIDVPYLLASLAFIPWPSDNNESLLPVLGLGWTLNYELFFYVIFASLIALSVRRRVLALCGLFAVLVFAGQWIAIDQPQAWYWTRSTLIQFAFGAIIAKLFLSGRWAVPQWLAAALVIAGIVAWQAACWYTPAFRPEWRGVMLGLPAAVIVFGLMRSRFFVGVLGGGDRFNPLQPIGDASYSLYLSHMFTLRVITLLCHKFMPGMPLALFFAVALGACVAVAIASHRWIEKPLLGLGKLPIFNTRSASALS